MAATTLLILADVIPQGVEDFGAEIGAAWPIIIALVFFVGFVGALGRWVWRKILHKIQEELKPVKEEFKPNGGSTFRDSLDRVEKRVMQQDSKLNLILNKLYEHDDRIDHLEGWSLYEEGDT